MQIQEIQNRINKYPQIALLGKKIAESESNHFVCKGVCSSANALLMGALQNKIQKNLQRGKRLTKKEFLDGDYTHQLEVPNIDSYNIVNVANLFLELTK